MKRLIALGLLLTTLGCTSQYKENDMNDHKHQHQHHQGKPDPHQGSQTGAELIVATDAAELVAGRPVTLKLMIHAADGTMVKEFEVVHDEKVHLVIVRDGLDHFVHIHPIIDAKGNLTASHTFPVGGNYKLFADYSPSGGGHATATGAVSIGGDSPTAPPLVAGAPGEIAADDVRATITTAPLKAEEPARVAFSVRDDEGPAKLEPYMGALGHLMFVSAAGKYVHVHPMAGDADGGMVEFEAHFPEPGLYKGWGQFKKSGQVRVIPFAVNVE